MLADEDDTPIAGAVVRGVELKTAVKIGNDLGVSGWRDWAAQREAPGQKTDPERLATTDGDGRCSVTVPDGSTVEIRAEGRWPETARVNAVSRGERLVWLRRVGKIRGRVQETDGTPVPNAKVYLGTPSTSDRWLSPASGRASEPSAVADVEGRFTYDVPCGVGLDVAAFRPGDEAASSRAFVRATARRPEVDLSLVLRGRARLVIDVVRPDGTPAAGAVVEVFDAGRARRLAQGRAEDGRFEQEVDGGVWTINAAFDASPAEFTQGVVVGLADGERVERTLQLIPTVAFAGAVVDGEGRGIGGARVEWIESPGTLRATASRVGTGKDSTLAPVPQSVVTDEAGRFSLGGLRPGRHVGRLITPGALPRRVEVTAPSDDVQLVLAASVRVRWTLAADRGAKVPGEVQFRWVPGGDERSVLASRLVGDRGVFWTSLPPGPGRLRVEEADGTLLVERELELLPGTTADLGSLAVAATRTIRWTNVPREEIGDPVFWAIAGADGQRESIRRVSLTAEGELRIQVREAEGDRVIFRFSSGTAAVSDVLPPRGDVDFGTLTPQPLGRLRGVVLRQTGSMPGGPATWRAVPDVRRESHEVAADGGFEGMLPAGRVRIVIRSEHFGSCEADVDILPGRTTDATFRLKQ